MSEKKMRKETLSETEKEILEKALGFKITTSQSMLLSLKDLRLIIQETTRKCNLKINQK